MIPQKINNKIFLTYEEKANYILDYCLYSEEILNKTTNYIKDYTSKNNKETEAIKHINKLLFLENMDIEKTFNVKESESNATTKLVLLITKKVLYSYEEEFKINLKTIFNIDFNLLKFRANSNDEFVILNDEEVKINKYEGNIYVIYHKNLIEENINMIIDSIGKEIERRDTNGVIITRLWFSYAIL